MKITNEKTKTISISDVDLEKHIIVGRVHNEPVIVTRQDFDYGKFISCSISGIIGNGDSYGRYDYIEDLLMEENREFHAFTNWKEALQWLIDNCE